MTFDDSASLTDLTDYSTPPPPRPPGRVLPFRPPTLTLIIGGADKEAELVEAIKREHAEICALSGHVVRLARKLGDRLLDAKTQRIHGGHGKWRQWLKQLFQKKTVRSLQNYMALAKYCRAHPEEIPELETRTLENALRRIAVPRSNAQALALFKSKPDRRRDRQPSGERIWDRPEQATALGKYYDLKAGAEGIDIDTFERLRSLIPRDELTDFGTKLGTIAARALKAGRP